MRSDVEVWGRFERYADLDERDHNDAGERINATLWDRDRIQVKISEALQNFDEFDLSTSDVERRTVFNGALGAGRSLTDKSELDVGYAFNMTDYQSPSLFDWNEHIGSAEFGHDMTDKSAGTVTVKTGVQSSDGNSEDGTLGSVLLGAKTRLTEKVNGHSC